MNRKYRVVPVNAACFSIESRAWWWPFWGRVAYVGSLSHANLVLAQIKLVQVIRR